MIGILTANINIRAQMSASSQDMGDLRTGDVVIGTVLGGWIAFDKVYRKTNGQAQAEPLGFTRYAAIYDPNSSATKFMMLIDANVGTSPSPAPPLPTLDIAIGGNEYETVNVELKPKP